LLAPAGGPPALQAALSAGADAVYLGLDCWSARAFAGNFDPAALLAAIERAHLFGARVYLALNVLLKDDELEPALTALAEPYRAGLDALIVTDLGLAALAREAYPGLELHASTQLDTHSSAQLGQLADLGFARAILARELSLDEIATLESHGLGLEAFVHGALCYGYSGACLLSSMASGRSGNRGRCSQACRMRYRLEATPRESDSSRGARRPSPAAGASDSGDGVESQRILSTSDLAAIGALPALLAAGVTSLKIEGRMKDPAYVAVTTAVYREALDAALADPAGFTVSPAWIERLEQSFSRGFTTAHLEGRHAAVRGGGRGGHRGLQIGRVEAVDEANGRVIVRVGRELHRADVLQIYTVAGATEPARLEALLAPASAGAGRLADGARNADGGRIVLRLRERVSVKDRVFRTSSGRDEAVAADAVAARVLARPIALAAVLRGRRGECPRLTVTGDGEEVTVESGTPLAAARTAGLTADKARRAIAALGGTPYELRSCEFAVDEGLFLGVGDLKELRRAAVAALDERRLGRWRRSAPATSTFATAPVTVAPTFATAAASPVAPGDAPTTPTAPALATPATPAAPAAPSVSPALQIILRVRPGEEPIAREGVDALCLDLRSGDDLGSISAAVARARSQGLALRVRAPEVLFDSDEPWARAVAAIGWDAVYARHVAALSWADTVLLEYPLQGLNPRTVPLFGAAGLVCSAELSLDDISRLTTGLSAATGGRGSAPAAPLVEALAFGREQVLVSRDTLGLAEGLAAPGSLTLTDTRGYAFPVLVATGETRIFSSRVTNVCGRLDELAAAGVRGVIVVQGDLNGDERRAFARDGLAGLAAFSDRGRFTTGHLFRGIA
jgi:collagenase-like PrtC family protease